MEYNYKVSYKNNNTIEEKMYSSVYDIRRDFNTTKEVVNNLYSKIPSIHHDVIVSIERLPVPIKKPTKITIDFS